MIKRLIDKNIIERGEFTLKSGEKSNIYIDLRKVISYPELHRDICEEISNRLETNIDLICGTPYGAIPYASYISIKNNIPMIFLRKEVKQHGTKKIVEGVYHKNQRVVLIEDVVTSGNSVRDAAKMLESQGLKVAQIVTIVSRSKKPLFYNDIPITFLYHSDDISNNKKSFKIPEIMSSKKTRICLAADVTTIEELFKLINNVGDQICVLKIHADIIVDFFDNLKETCATLANLKTKYNFLIWEDRKLADIGKVMARQAQQIANWADIVSVHVVAGLESLKPIDFIDLIVVIEMSCTGHLMNSEYQSKATEIVEHLDNVVGVVAQHRIQSSKELLHFVPGISLTNSSDGVGQQYNSPESKEFADVFVIGRGIYLADEPAKEIEKYKNLCLY